MGKDDEQNLNKEDDFIEKQDVRDRKFGDVILPKPPEKITNRKPPSPEELGPLANL